MSEWKSFRIYGNSPAHCERIDIRFYIDDGYGRPNDICYMKFIRIIVDHSSHYYVVVLQRVCYRNGSVSGKKIKFSNFIKFSPTWKFGNWDAFVLMEYFLHSRKPVSEHAQFCRCTFYRHFCFLVRTGMYEMVSRGSKTIIFILFGNVLSDAANKVTIKSIK